MADFVAPQFQNPDLLKSYIQGQQAGQEPAFAAQQYAQGQQGLQEGGLKLDQLRQTLQITGQKNDMLKALMSQIQKEGTQDASNQGGGTGGSQTGPQGSVAAPQSTGNNYGYSPENLSQHTLQAVGELAPEMLKGREAADAASLKAAQVRAHLPGSPLLQYESFASNPNAGQALVNNPAQLAQWPAIAKKYGADPTDLSAINVRRVATLEANAQRAGLKMDALPMPDHYTNVQSVGQTVQQDDNTGKQTPIGESAYDKQRIDIESQGLKIRESAAAGKTFSPEMGQLGAALAEKGVSLPSGFRAQAQQAQLYQGLLDRNPGKTPDQIADLVKGGKIDLAGEMKEQTTAAGIVGKVKYAENELTQSIPLALAASANVPRGSFMPLNKLMQATDAQLSDPALRDLKIKTQSVMNAYDMLSARSGTDVAKREEAHKLLSSADSPQAYSAALSAMAQEAQVAHKAGDMSMGRGGISQGQSQTINGFKVTRVN